MPRLKVILVFFAAIFGGCATTDLTPVSPDFTATYRGNYKAIADCATVGLRRLPDWSRVDLDTQSKVEFVKGANGSVIGVITVSPNGPDSTLVVSKVPRAIYGADYYKKLHKPIFDACASG